MRLKQKIDGNTCAAYRCKEPAAALAVHVVLGNAPLCVKHAAESKSDADFHPAEAADAPGYWEPAPDASEPTSPDSFGGQDDPPATSVASIRKELAVRQVQLAQPAGALVVAPDSQASKLQALERVLADDLATVREFVIEGSDDEAFAKQELDGAMRQWKELEEQRTSATKPMNEALRQIQGWFKGPQTHLKSIEGAWKVKLRDRALAAQAEAARLAAHAAELASAGAIEEAREALVAVSVLPTATPAGISVIDRWTYEITDEAALPRDYLQPNTTAIGKVVAALKEKAKIPGVRVWNDPIVRNVAG